jgi:hypothetical protein
MNTRKRTKILGESFICVCVLLLLLILNTSPVYCQDMDIELMRQSSVIFIGTVSRMRAVSFSKVPVSERTAIVKVELMLQTPPAIAIKSDQEVTVRLKDPAQFSTGTKAIFYTDGWILGDGIALREVGHKILPRAMTFQVQEQRKKSFMEAKRQLTNKKIQAQIESSDVVALGRVINIRSSAVAAQQRKFITEHDPDWRDAIIKVQDGIKGVVTGDEIVVRFPGSEDVAFFGIPKFKIDEEHMLFLKKDRITGFPKAFVGDVQTETYAVEKQLDVLPKKERDRVRQIFRTIK